MLGNNADAHISNLGYLRVQEVAEPSLQRLVSAYRYRVEEERIIGLHIHQTARINT